METLKVAAIQTTGSSDKAANVAQAVALIERAAGEGARLGVLPEMVNWIGPDEGFGAIAEPIPGPTTEAFQNAARRSRISLIAGSIAEKGDGTDKSYNTSVAIDANGEIVAKYRKIHMFDVAIGDQVNETESDFIEAGTEVVVTELEGHRIGLSICYDLRFPELFRALADANCDIMVVPAAWYLFTGKDHWEVLVRARAIENQAYVIAACMSGRHPAGVAYGRSMVVNPWGTVLATAQDGPGCAIAEADFDELARVRRELPALASRRLRATASVRA